MSNWFTAHLILYVQFKEPPQNRFSVWENIVLIKADSEDEAFAKAERRGREDEGDDDGSFRWDGRPARWVFAGVRKLIACDDPRKRPDDGSEVSYTELEVGSEEELRKLAEGEPVAVRYEE
jgi:hypothetical protein